MNESEENTALSIILSNTKRKNRTFDILTIARALKKLEDCYGSRQAVAEKVELSIEMIRQFTSSLTLEDEVQKMILNRQIDSVDIVSELSKIKNSKEQISAAKGIQNFNTKDARNILRLMRQSKVSFDEARDNVVNTKKMVKSDDIHIFILDFTDDEKQKILRIASKKKIKPVDLIKQIILDKILEFREDEF